VTTSSIETLHHQLTAARNPDGGWGYYEGKASRLEPTCWAALYLRQNGASQPDEHTAPAGDWLASCQRDDGLLVDVAAESPNLAFNGLAALVLQDRDWSAPPVPGLLAALVRSKGQATRNTDHQRQDNSLRAWSWSDGTFSWVEPTSWCLLALKKAGSHPAADVAARIDEAEHLLIDRVCRTGGWNYGNSNVLGQELAAHVPTTALGLLALQDHREHADVRRSLDHLVAYRLSEPAGMALALTSICLRVYGLPAVDVDERLLALSEHHGFFGNLHVAAMALYALSGEEHEARAFRL
jgi:hypothetical protein